MQFFLRLWPWAPALLAVVSLLSACDEEKKPYACVSITCDAGPACPDIYVPPPSAGDADGDGTPDDDDPDADGDGLDNEFENLGGPMCAPNDPDGDGIDNWLDTDSDNDGIPDGRDREVADPYSADADGDGFSDLIEQAAGTSATSAADHPPAGSSAVLVPYMDGEVTATVGIDNVIENADIFILIDTTLSMAPEAMNLSLGIEEVIIPQATSAFASVAFGVGVTADYPIAPFGCFGGEGCYYPDPPFHLLLPMTVGFVDEYESNVVMGSSCSTFLPELTPGPDGRFDIVEAVEAIPCNNGGDYPEGYVPALWTTATGMGLTWPGGEVPSQLGCPPGTRGYPCFRGDALPIILLIGDDGFHNGPRAALDYGFASPSWTQATTALNDIGAKVVSLFSGEEIVNRNDYEELARATGSLAPDGTPLVFDIDANGVGIDMDIVGAMETLAAGIPLEILAVRAVDDTSDAVDALMMVAGTTTAECTAYGTKDDTSFFDVEGGAHCDFVFTLRNDIVEATDAAQVIPLDVQAITNGDAVIATRKLYLVVVRDGVSLVL